METDHLTIKIRPDIKGRASLTYEELKGGFDYLISQTARSVSDTEIQTAFAEALEPWVIKET